MKELKEKMTLSSTEGHSVHILNLPDDYEKDTGSISTPETALQNLTTSDVILQTPIEIALAVDDDGCTTTKKLYEWLELDSRNYSRWVKVNILDNPFAEEGVDFSSLRKKSRKGVLGRPTNDYKITAPFAKKLAMMQKTERGEQARIYFLCCEEAAKKLTVEKQKFLMERAKGKVIRLSLTEAIEKSGENVRLHGHAYSLYTNLVYKTALGMNKNQLQLEYGLSNKANVRDYLSAEELEAVYSVEQMIASMLLNGRQYQMIKEFCEAS